jgi:hypothetical protein
MILRPLAAAVLFALSTLSATAHADEVRRPYIIQLADKPIASYDGAVAGLAATQPVAGRRLDLLSNNVQLYNAYLGQKHATVQASIAGATIMYNYSVVLNGFSAMLTDTEVRTLMARGDVSMVWVDTPQRPATTYTSKFLGLDQPDGLWAKVGGKGKAGENMVIGIVDTGAWPENPGYADRVDANGIPTFDVSGTQVYGAPPSTWKGTCQAGEGFTAADCNNKLIGAQYFDANFRNAPGVTAHWTEFRSPRDSLGGPVGEGGHGTHTSTTAAGNDGPDAIVGGINLGRVSGMAPRARVAMYKVCWTFNDPAELNGARNTCYQGDSVAAIEKAVVDGVNVINFSISGGSSVTDVVEQAFLHASNAGVFVAASGGNSGELGPGGEVAHVSPWLATVAASTHNRLLQADVILGNGAKYTGASLNNAPLPVAPIVRSEDVALPGADPVRVRQCWSQGFQGGPAVLDPDKVRGKIVTCVRGANDRVDKSLAVLQAGGVGMVLVDTGGGLIAELHSVPTVHVNAADGAQIKAYAATPGATASFTKFVSGASAVPAPIIAAFSSRGPNLYDGNLLKPDMTAPGVDIIAGVSPSLTPVERQAIIDGTLNPGAAWASYQGTSMASPHVAGISALLKQAHPTWSPAMIKSALMTTATDTYPDGKPGNLAGQLPFAQGAGHINPNGANDPGLVYDARQADYKKYMCGMGVTNECTGQSSGTIVSYNLNMPSITVSNVLGNLVVNRTVTNVSDTSSTYRPTVVAPAGFNAVVAPAALAVAPGASATFTVTFSRKADVALNTWQYGSLTWNDGVHAVRSPITLRAGALISATPLVRSDKATAAKTLGVRTGFTGKMATAYGGLKEVDKTVHTVEEAPEGSLDSEPLIQAACNAGGTGVRLIPVTFPAGTVMASFELFNADTQHGARDDLDLALIDSSGEVVGLSGSAGSDEAIRLPSPAAGNYRVCVLGYSLDGDGPTDFALSSAIVTTADRNGNFRTLVPNKVYADSTATISTSWSGLALGKRYFGGVQLLDNTGALAATTMYMVETNNPLPLAERTARTPARDTGR